MKKRFGVIGGDRRQAELARLLREDGNAVCTWDLCQADSGSVPALEQLSAEVIVLPLPLCWKEGVLNGREQLPTAELFRGLPPDRLVLAGQVRERQACEAAEMGVTLIDYFRREELAVANAIPTAEGVIQLAMERLPRTIHGLEVLVLGYGRIGRLLAQRLCGLGARVTVAARSWEAQAWAKAAGCGTVDTAELLGGLEEFGLVINTVPALLLDKALLRQLPDSCLCIDAASIPGIDLAAAEALGLETVWARGLPGKLSPVTAAEAIRDTVYHILKERSECV